MSEAATIRPSAGVILDDRRYEKIDGTIYMMAAPSMNHQMISGNINTIFKLFLKGKTCKPYEAVNVFFDDMNHFIPDVVILCDRSKARRDGIHGAPELVVEILSPSTSKRDLADKLDVYAKYGVKEYWIVNPFSKEIFVYYFADGKLLLNRTYLYMKPQEIEFMPEDDKAMLQQNFTTSLFEGLVVHLEDVFADLQ